LSDSSKAIMFTITMKDIPDILGDGAMTTEELAKASKTNSTILFRYMRYLASYNIFSRIGHNQWSNNPQSAILRVDHPNSIKYWAHTWHYTHLASMISSFDTLETGTNAFYQEHQTYFWDYFAKNKDFEYHFETAMDITTKTQFKAITEDYDFSKFKKVVDIAGGVGNFIMPLLRKFSNIKGILLDRDIVIESAKDNLKKVYPDIKDRMGFVAGSYMNVPTFEEDVDAVLIKSALHNLPDSGALKVLKSIRKAIGNKKITLILVEAVLDEDIAFKTNEFFNILMTLYFDGKERTMDEWKVLLKESGFEVQKYYPLRDIVSILEVIPIK